MPPGMLSMPVMVVRIREMRMRVRERRVPMRVAVPGARRDRFVMRMLVMLVVRVRMVMGQRFMHMRMVVLLAQVQPDAEPHQRAGDQQRRRQRFAHCQRQQRADERRDRKISAGTRGAKVAQADHEQRQAHAIGEKPEQQRAGQIRQRRQRGAQHESQRQIDRTGHQPFH